MFIRGVLLIKINTNYHYMCKKFKYFILIQYYTII